MKKIFLFLMLGAIALGVSSCDPNGNVINPDEDHLINFSASVESTASGTNYTVISADKNCYFFALHVEAAAFPLWTREKINDYLKSYFEERAYPYGLFQDQKTLPVFSQPSTRWVILMFKVGAGYTVDGEVEYKFFTTSES